MEKERVVQGRVIRPEDVRRIRELLREHPSWNRTRLSRELCAGWNWRTPTGQMKDMACRSLLLKLERKGEVRLPARERRSVNHLRHRAIPLVLHSTSPIVCALKDLRPIEVRPVRDRFEEELFASLVSQYHYRGYQGIVGENLKYMVVDRWNRSLACLLFGSAAWKTAPRDRYVGWDAQTRKRNLPLVTNNMRFLILPWVRVKSLGSHILGRVVQRVRQDWREKYGHPVDLLETFVEKERFRGTCYRAANWIYVGDTKGRTRNDRDHTIQVATKAVYLYSLVKRVRDRLREGSPVSEREGKRVGEAGRDSEGLQSGPASGR